MSINEERLKEWIEQVTKKLAHLEANQMAIINGDFCDTNTVPQEPLIEDEEIREIIRAWAKVNDAMALKYNYDENSLDDIYRNTIAFNMGLGLKDGEKYTIAELCGEEEAPEPIEPMFIDLDGRIKEKGEE